MSAKGMFFFGPCSILFLLIAFSLRLSSQGMDFIYTTQHSLVLELLNLSIHGS